MIKSTVRQEYLQRRMDMEEEALQQQTVLMAFNFKKLQLSPVKYLLSYYPLVNRHEFDVSVCEDILRSQYPLLQTAWPSIHLSMNEMEARLITKDGLFVKNKYNILEPIGGEPLEPEAIDMVFVPLVAFDSRGYRVGYGKGYYDRYLSRCRPGVVKIGFSFFDPVDSIDDINEFDVPLSFCITPHRIYEF